MHCKSRGALTTTMCVDLHEHFHLHLNKIKTGRFLASCVLGFYGRCFDLAYPPRLYFPQTSFDRCQPLHPRQDMFKYGAVFSFYKVDAMTIMRLFLVILFPFKNKHMSVSPVYTTWCYLCIVFLTLLFLKIGNLNLLFYIMPFLF